MDGEKFYRGSLALSFQRLAETKSKMITTRGSQYCKETANFEFAASLLAVVN